MKRTLLVAAENAALPGGKVGGIGDVLRNLPLALADHGWMPSVVTPAYGTLNRLPGAQQIDQFCANFAGRNEQVSVYRIPGPDDRVLHLALEHPLLSPQGPGKIYCDDGNDRPFATDAGKFAFFAAAVAAFVDSMSAPPDVLHLHDWHAAIVLLLRQFDPALRSLKRIRSVYTIHNLALQGVRPLTDDESSLHAWFPDLPYRHDAVVDPRHRDCINPMAVAIRLADKLNTVSPTYAQEILRPSDPQHGFYGGEGLEQDLLNASADNRLSGILNGCLYEDGKPRRRDWQRIANAIRDLPATSNVLPNGAGDLNWFSRRPPNAVLTSVGRITPQKVSLFLQAAGGGQTALGRILLRLGKASVFILLGNGDSQLEEQLASFALRHANFLFVRGYYDDFSDCLYESGDLFLMPSSFEPCGISQMLAMRAGQPCVVHDVGGLRDTVADGNTGFVFGGATLREQAEEFVDTVGRALTLMNDDPRHWHVMQDRAAAMRFSWRNTARAYIEKLYES